MRLFKFGFKIWVLPNFRYSQFCRTRNYNKILTKNIKILVKNIFAIKKHKNSSTHDDFFIIECQKARMTRSLSSRLETNKLLSECHEHHLLPAPPPPPPPPPPPQQMSSFHRVLLFFVWLFSFFFYLYRFLFLFCLFFSEDEEIGEFFCLLFFVRETDTIRAEICAPGYR